MNWTATVVFVALFVFVTIVGFVAAHWRRGDLAQLDEWGLAGRRFGTIVSWFLLGGDLYTAYTFIAVPALVFGAGALGFFALPYTILVFPFAFVVFPKLWQVSRKHGYVTAADFVSARYGSGWLGLAIAVTGIVATMPYIALQLVGIEVVIGALGFHVHQWIARTGIDRDCDGHADLSDAYRGVDRDSDSPGRNVACVRGTPRRESAAETAIRRFARRLQCLCNAGFGLGVRAVLVPTLDYGPAQRKER